MALIVHKLDSSEEEFIKEDKTLKGAERRIFCLGHLLKIAASFKDMPKANPKHHVLKVPRDKKKKNKKNWVVNGKERKIQVEEVKMLSDKIAEPLLDLDRCNLHELISILQKIANDPSYNFHQEGFRSYIANHVIKKRLINIIEKL